MGFRLIEDAGDGRERMIGRVALTQNSASRYSEWSVLKHLRHRPEISSTAGTHFLSSASNAAEFCRFRRKPAAIYLRQGRSCSSWAASRNNVASSPKSRREHHAERQAGRVPGQRHRHRGLAGHVEHGGCRHVTPQDRGDVRQIFRHRIEFADAQGWRAKRRTQEHVAALEETGEAARNLEGAELRGHIVGRTCLLRVVGARKRQYFEIAVRHLAAETLFGKPHAERGVGGRQLSPSRPPDRRPAQAPVPRHDGRARPAGRRLREPPPRSRDRWHRHRATCR